MKPNRAQRHLLLLHIRWTVGCALVGAAVVGGVADTVTQTFTENPYKIGAALGVFGSIFFEPGEF